MSPEQQQEFDRMKQQIEEMSSFMRSFLSKAELDPQIARTVATLLVEQSDTNPNTKEQAVNESGSSSYTVPAAFDGFLLIDEKLVGYYNP